MEYTKQFVQYVLYNSTVLSCSISIHNINRMMHVEFVNEWWGEMNCRLYGTVL